MVEEDLHQGRLIELPKPFAGRSRPYNLLYPHQRYVPLRVRTFVDYLLGHQAVSLRRPDPGSDGAMTTLH